MAPRTGDTHEAPTRVERPRFEQASSEHEDTARDPTRAARDVTLETPRSALDRMVGSTHDRSFDRSVLSPADALHVEEIRRMRAFAVVVAPLAIVVLAVLPFLGGDPVAKGILSGALVLVAIAAGVLRWRLERAFVPWLVAVFVVTCVTTTFGAVWFFGVFGPAVVVVPFGLHVFSVGRSFGTTLAVWASCALAYLALAVLVGGGLLPDGGVIRPAITGAQAIVVVVLVETIFFATFLVGRASRRALLRSLEQHDRALRKLTHREALLKEARDELDRALEAGGLGRFSDETLGSYQLGRLLGRGGMGEVYEARDTKTGTPAAVKLLHSFAMSDAPSIRRFQREARLVAGLASPNVVRVLEVGGPESAVPYIAMERLDGEDLADRLRREPRLPLADVLPIVRDVAGGLATAHAAGVIHRDVKPRNLFHHRPSGEGRGVWKLLDFGVSRKEEDDGTLTRDRLVGTPAYMAPEQVQAGKVDARADVHALGVIAYRALTGRPAFSGDTMAETIARVIGSMPPRPSSVVALPPEVDDVLLVALAKDPARRFASVDELAAALEGASRGELSEGLRDRAAKLAATQPWDTKR